MMSENAVKVKLDDLVKDDDIYPREKPSSETAKSFADSLEAGYADFPKIWVQQLVLDSGDEELVIIDGVHRVEAYREYNERVEDGEKIEEIEAEPVISKGPVPKSEHLTELRVEAIKRNLEHGDRLSREDKKAMCRRMARDDPKMEITEEKFHDIFAVPQQTINDWLGDVRSEQRESRDSLIYKLNMLGWTQEAIAEKVGVTQQRVQQITNNTDFGKICNEYESNKSVSEIAEYHNLSVPTTWGLILRDEEDEQKLRTLDAEVKGLSCKPRAYDVWRFSGPHDLFGYDYDGRIPGQVVLQLLYFYTGEGDLVVDPMAGSGTVVDACLVMNRECFAYDVDRSAADERAEIRQGEAMDALKELNRRPELIFLDPPYFKKKEEEYSEESISSLSREKYLDYFQSLADVCAEVLPSNGKVALLMSDFTDEEDPSKSIFIHHYIDRFEEKDFKTERIIQCPLSTQQIHADIQNKFVERKRLARLSRNLVIFNAP